MRTIIALFKIRFVSAIQYRTAAIAGIITQFVWGLMSILMFKSFFDTNPSAFPMTFSQLSDYIWLQQALLNFFALWIFDNEIFQHISSGQIAYELVRPYKLYSYWTVRNLAYRTARTLLRCGPTIVIALLIPKPYGLGLPQNFILFIITLCLALMVVVAITMFIYISAIYTISAAGIRMLTMTIGEFLTGAIIPLPFFPENLQKIIERTPFGAMQNIPLRVYSGHLNNWSIIFVQFTWLAILITIGYIWMSHAMKKIVIQGG